MVSSNTTPHANLHANCVSFTASHRLGQNCMPPFCLYRFYVVRDIRLAIKNSHVIISRHKKHWNNLWNTKT